MKKKEWNEGLNHIDPDLVEKYVEQKDRLRQKNKKPKGVWLRFGAIAACFALILSAVIVVTMLQKDNMPHVPTWDTAQYSAKEIANLFDTMDRNSVATNAYTKKYVPNSKYLYIDNVTNDEYLNVFQYANNNIKLSEAELRTFIDTFLPKLEKSLDISVPQYNVEEVNYSTGNRLFVFTDVGPYSMSISQDDMANSFRLRKVEGGRQIVIGGETIQIDQRLSDDDILDSIQSIKKKLFKIFNVSFSDAKVIRKFGSNSKNGAEYIYIYFYNESAHPLNSISDKPISDCICISFDNFANSSGDIVSDSILKVSSVNYYKNRVNIKNTYSLIANGKKISISEAESLLYKGYVFGGHACPLCMSAQDKVSFEGYDFVDIEYVFGSDYETGKPTDVLPFYAFYKNIGTSANGNTIYAKTYVPAVQVSGYEEYFESQKVDHVFSRYVVDIG